VDFGGIISDLGGRCPNVTLTVGGTDVATDKATDYKKATCGDLREGEFAAGQGTTQADGTVKATVITVKKHGN
jgi:Domain of unknown function (DUF5666)